MNIYELYSIKRNIKQRERAYYSKKLTIFKISLYSDMIEPCFEMIELGPYSNY